MKAFKKIVLTMLISCLLFVPLMGTAQATALFDPDNINSILSFFGIDTSDPESIQDAIDEIRDGGLSGIMNILGINVADILDALQSYLDNMSVETTASEETTVIIPEESTEAEKTEKEEVSTKINNVPDYPSYNYSQESTTAKPLPIKPSKVEVQETTTEETSKKVTIEDKITANTEVKETESDTENSDSILRTILIASVIFAVGFTLGIVITKKVTSESRKLED